MDKPKPLISINSDKCAPCSGLVCIGVCPQGILEVGENKKPQIVNVASCTQCGVCVSLCPTRAITAAKGNNAKDR